MRKRRRDKEPGADKIRLLTDDCVHHQAALVPNPAILSLDDLAAGLVRFAHMSHASKFRKTFQESLEAFLKHLIRVFRSINKSSLFVPR